MSLTEDIVKPTASEVRQMIDEATKPLEDKITRLEQILENMAEAQKRLRAATRQFDRY